MNNNTTKKLLDVPGLADYISTTTNAIYVMVCNGKIPDNCIVKIGASLKFDKASVDAWLENCKKKSEGVNTELVCTQPN